MLARSGADDHAGQEDSARSNPPAPQGPALDLAPKPPGRRPAAHRSRTTTGPPAGAVPAPALGCIIRPIVRGHAGGSDAPKHLECPPLRSAPPLPRMRPRDGATNQRRRTSASAGVGKFDGTGGKTGDRSNRRSGSRSLARVERIKIENDRTKPTVGRTPSPGAAGPDRINRPSRNLR